MKYLGLDYGAKRIGIAVSDDGGTIAFPRATVQNDEKLLACILQTAKEENIGMVVVGDTRAVSGRENPVTKEAEIFIEKLEKALEIPVECVWEAWSSIEVSAHAGRGHGHDDAAAAAFILQRYLDMRVSRAQ